MAVLTRNPSSVRLLHRKWLAATATSVLAMAAATPAMAQGDTTKPASATPAPAAAKPDPAGAKSDPAGAKSDASQPVIIVTGIRGSLQHDLNVKRNAVGVVDAITAEDIGKFPDPNVASAMQRIPGVTIQRSGPRGDANGVTVRGFGGDFNDTLVDGRHMSTAAGGRAVDFTTVGADFIGQVNVLKTPDVELSTSAIGATINILLPKPFDHPGFRFAAFGGGTLQSRDKHIGPKGGLLVSDTFADGKFGILADVAYDREETRTNHVFIPGWVGNHFAPCQTGPINRTCIPTSDSTSAAWADPNNRKTVLGWFPQQIGADQQTTKDSRVDGRIALQWRPSDSVLLTLDDNYSKETIHSTDYGYGAWFNGDDLRNVKYDSNGSVVDFNQFGTPMDFNANATRTVNERNQAGANLKWNATDNLSFEADGSLARAELNPGKSGYGDSMDIGYGGYNPDPSGPFCSSGGCVNTILGANTGVQILGPSSDNLPVVHDVGPAGNTGQFLDTTQMGSHVIVRIDPYNTDLVKQAKLLGRWESDNFKLTFGGQYIDDKLHQESTNTFADGVFFSYTGYGPPSGRTTGLWPLPASAFTGSISTSGFIPGYNNNALAPGLLVYSPYAIYNALEAAGHNTAPGFDQGSVLNVEEKTLSFFLKANFVTDIAGMPFHFSAGLRDESTHLTVSAIGRALTGLTINTGDPTVLNTVFSDPEPITDKSFYTYLLPSMDMKLELTRTLDIRLDASRTLTRPQLGALKPTVSFASLRRGSLNGSGGNPTLKPYLADNFDAAVEWFYAPNSYVSIDGFYKHITNFIVGGVHQESFSGVIDPFTGQTAVFNINGQVNGPDADVRGLELAWQWVIGNTGFGFQANATLVNTNRKFPTDDISGSAFAITGLANSANLIGFYDKNGLQFRVAANWRDSYLLGLGQAQGGTFGAEPVYVDKQLQIDAQASYDITRQFTVYASVTNLNNSNYSTHGRFSDQPLDIYNYGRRYEAGIRFKY